jgi:hypothetical protein
MSDRMPDDDQRPDSSPLTLLLLAAGLGSRYGGLKQLDPVGPGGATLMDYTLWDAWRAGFRRAVFVIRPEMVAAFDETIRPRYESRLVLHAAEQRLEDLPAGFTPPAGRQRPWGTTHAVLSAKRYLTGSFAVVNADDCYGPEAISAAAGFLRAAAPMSRRQGVVGFRLDRTLSPSGGVNRALLERGAAGQLRSVVEVTGIVADGAGAYTGRAGSGSITLASDAIVSMNLWAFTPAILPSLSTAFDRFLTGHPDDRAECYLPEAVREALERGEVTVEVLPTESRWCGVTYAEDRSWVQGVLREAVRSGVYPEHLWA